VGIAQKEPDRNIALRLAYDGTDFVGSQWQNNGRSVQAALEDAWLQFAQEQRRFTLAGRTDAGVHAQGQVANVRTKKQRQLHVIRRGLNALLPRDVAVLEAYDVAPDFHARHSAHWRKYRYLIEDGPVLMPLLRHYVLHVEQSLDRDAMQEALHALLGEHDFAAFTVADPSQRTTVRRCDHAACQRIEVMGHPLIAIELVANAFLRHMVRAIIGTLLLVGRRQQTPAEFAEVLQGRNRRRAGPTAPARGLTLVEVGYPVGLLPILASDDEPVAHRLREEESR
jgi:tRNA pseudouridine38-40 synthase